MKVLSYLLKQKLLAFFLRVIFSCAYSMEESASKANSVIKSSEELDSVENLINLENSVTEYGITDLNNLPYELKLHIAKFLEVNYQSKWCHNDIEILIKKIYQLSQITQEWRNVLSNPDIWKIVFSKFFKNILMEKTYKETEDIQKINMQLSDFKIIVESIKSSVIQKGLNKNIINAMSNAFSSVIKEVELNLRLHRALHAKDVNGFRTFIHKAEECGLIVTGRPSIWDTLLLYHASNKNMHDIVKLLLAKNCDVNSGNKYGDVPLLAASDLGYKEIGEILLKDKCIQIDAKNNYGSTALMCACKQGKDDVVKMLLANGADVNAQDNEGRTPLMWAVEECHLKILQTLLVYNFSNRKGHKDEHTDFDNCAINAQDKNGDTVLIRAIKIGSWIGVDIQIVEFLLKRGAKLDTQNNVGRTALICACILGKQKIIELLLEFGANVNVRDKSGQTALAHGVSNGCSPNLVYLLIKNGAVVNF